MNKMPVSQEVDWESVADQENEKYGEYIMCSLCGGDLKKSVTYSSNTYEYFFDKERKEWIENDVFDDGNDPYIEYECDNCGEWLEE